MSAHLLGEFKDQPGVTTIEGLDVLESGFVEQLPGRETAYVCASKGALVDREAATFVEPVFEVVA